MTRLLALLSLLTAAPAAAADSAPSWEKFKLSEYVQSVKLGGDLRLRYDNSMKRGAGTTDRGRGRFRLRVGAEILLPENFRANLRLATGTGEQTSTNQSADNLSSQKAINLDQVFLKWSRVFAENLTVHAQGGRMANPLWRIYSSEVLWDEDFNPEGVSQGVEWLLPDCGLTLFANALQMVADEDSNTPKNQYLFSQQAGFEKTLPWQSRLRLAAAYHKWSDEQRSTLGQTTVADGNRRTAGGILLNRFGVGELTGQLSSWAGKVPLALQATLIRNFRARGDMDTTAGCTAGLTCPAARDGYEFGAIVGKAQAKGSWEAAWFKRYSQTDATVADVADTDFGDAGTNAHGHQFWVAYAPAAWSVLKAKYTVMDVIDRTVAPGDKAVNRAQIDFSVRF